MATLKINWSTIITQSITMLVAGVLLAAATFLWNNTQNNRNMIKDNFASSELNLKITEEKLVNKIAILEVELKFQKMFINELVEKLNSKDIDLNSLENLETVEFNEESKKNEIEKISKELLYEIDVRQQPLNLPSNK
jgi:Na+-transporting NADH:ubiquinone oxidoreductase subunit NqrC